MRALISRIGSAVAIAAIAVIGAASCRSTLFPPTMEPENPQEKGKTVDEVMTTAGGVKISSRGDSWKGEEAIRGRVTPIYVKIENNSDRPLRIHYRRLALITDDGNRFTAIPPYKISGTAQKPMVVTKYTGLSDVPLDYSGFSVYPYLSPYYPGVQVWDDTGGYDLAYNRLTYVYWKRIGLPTPEMLRRALPEGVVKPGGKVSGYLYFPWSARSSAGAELQVELVDAKRSHDVTMARLPMKSGGPVIVSPG